MTSKSFIEFASTHLSISKAEVTRMCKAIDEARDAYLATMQSGDTVKVNDVTYTVKTVGERTGTVKAATLRGEPNPAFGKTWTVPEHDEVVVRIPKSMKKMFVENA